HGGTIRADGAVATGDGRIVLKATRNATLEAGSVTSASGPAGGRIEVNAGDTTLVEGTVRATGSEGEGGTVHLLGANVGIHGSARVDASGARGGGTVLAGGEFQGRPGVTAVEGAPIHNATATFFGDGAAIAADAVASGDGGKVVVWADHTTRSHGTISARGGAASGNGGLVETSGKVTLDVTRGPDVRAPKGLGGTWLLDPNDFEVVAGSVITNNTAQPVFSTLAESSKVGVDLINLQLDAGSNVVLSTASQGPLDGLQPGNITISAPIVKTFLSAPALPVTTTSLVVQAHNNIVINPGGGISATGNPLSVTLAANNFSGAGTGGVTVNDAIITNGGALNISGRGAIALNAPVSTVRTATIGSSGSVTLSSTADTVTVGAAVLSGASFTATGFAGVNVNGTITTPNNGSVSLASNTGPVTVNQEITGGFFGATSSGAGSMLTLAAPVTSAGSATLTADDMEILATLTTGSSLTVRQSTGGRPIDLGTNTAGSLSLTQAELSRFATGGGVTYGNSASGALVVTAPVTVGSTAVSMNSGSAFTVNAGGSVSTAVPLSVNSPTVTLDGPVSAQGVTITTDNIAANANVTSAGDINLLTRSYFRAINLGAVGDSGGALDVSAPELNRFVTGGSGVLRVGSTGSGPITIVESIAPSGTQTLSLRTVSGISQNAGKTITVQNLALQAYDDVNLPEDNVVAMLSGALCCSGNTFTFASAPGVQLTIGDVDGLGGLYNFNSGGTGTIVADRLAVSGFVEFDTLGIMARSPGVKIDFGGADGAGVLGISAQDAANVYGTTLKFGADLVDVTGPVAFNTAVVEIAPVTPGLNVNIIPDAAGKSPANLELKPMELAMLSASNLTLGDAVNTGPLTVAAGANVNVTGNVSGFFTLRTGDPSGITLSAPVTGNSVGLTADAMAIAQNVTAANGNLVLVPNLGGTQINLGGADGSGVLGIDAGEAGRLFAPNGTLFIGNSATGNIDVTAPIAFGPPQIGDLNVTSGGALTVGGSGPQLDAPGSIFLTAQAIVLDGPVTSTVAGDISIAADAPAINALVTTTASDINVMPVGSTTISLGGTGSAYLDNNELNNLRPSSGVARIGDLANTGAIDVVGAINLAGGAGNVNTLSLVTGNGVVTQSGGATITVPNLAVRAAGAINLPENNNVSGAVALQTDFGPIDFKHAGANALTIGAVDGVTGVRNFCCSGQPITLRSDDIAVTAGISANFGSNNVVLLPVGVAQPITIAGSPGGTYSLVQGEIDLIEAASIFVGNSTTGPITVANPVSFPSAVSLATSTANSIDVNGSLTAQGNATFFTGTFNVNAAVTSNNSGSISATAHTMNFAAPVAAPSGSITLVTPAGASTSIELGGATTGESGMLVLNTTELGFLSYGGLLTIGSADSDDMTIVSTAMLPGNVKLVSGNLLDVQSGTFSAGGDLTVVTDSLTIGVAGLAANGNVTIQPLTSGITLGTQIGGELAVPFAELDRISTPAGTLVFDTTGTLTVNEGLPFNAARVSNVRLSGGTVSVLNPVSAAGELALRGNTLDIQNTVTSTGGGRISAARRTLGAMSVGAPGATLTSAAVEGQFVTSGVVQLGDAASTSTLQFNAPLDLSGFGSATLSASSTISQTAGSTLTAPRLRLNGNGQINLPEANSVQTLAGGNTGSSFTFTSTGTVTVGPTVDGVAGLTGGSLNLRSDDLDRAGPGGIVNSSATLGPRLPGTQMNLGGNPGGGVYGVDGAELAGISSFTLNFGNNTAGQVTVSAPMVRSSGTLGILTAPTEAVNVNGALAGPSGVQIDAGTIHVNQPIDSTFGTVNLTARAPATLAINAPVTAGSNVALNSDSTAINALVTANPGFGTVTIVPTTPGTPVSLGVEAGGALSITQGEFERVSTANLTVGNTNAGPMTIGAPITLNVNQLSLFSGGAIVQTGGAPIVLSRVNATGVRTGNLRAQTANGAVTLVAGNEVPGALQGFAGGLNDFDFVNALPMLLQQVSAGAGGRTRINSGLFAPLPFGAFPEGGGPDLQAVLIAAIDQISKINDTLDATDAEGKKKTQEENRKRQTCD
ncbi:MAG: hypothetical protein IT529_18715, partial [Burkholderiales bacterium]|nr:hypothetical protein [Burkholderiales bacterium]